MITCGIKISHDSAVAVIDGQRLLFSIEIEKINNGQRYSEMGDLDRIDEILRAEGIEPAMVDQFVVDGWWTIDADNVTRIVTSQNGTSLKVPVAPYTTDGAVGDVLRRYQFPALPGGPLSAGYVSYSHASHHVLGSYCTSPFAVNGEDALVLAWDGGMLPRLYRVSCHPLRVDYAGSLLPLSGSIFTEFSKHLDPFWPDPARMTADELWRHELEVPGKAMAYAALGTVERGAFKAMQRLFNDLDRESFGSSVGEAIQARKDELFPGMSSADLIATFQEYVGRELLEALARRVRAGGSARPNLCLSGGCALNIKWNSMLRDSGLFSEIWIPPFPNDSGAAIGSACCEMVRTQGQAPLGWDVYSGPQVSASQAADGWKVRRCDEAQLAALLHEQGEPVVVLDGRAELGPRALGNRSILAPATTGLMKDRLNDIKHRAYYRPVAPICLESEAKEVFDPGGTDPYMLFEHYFRPGWAEKVPAVEHLDGSARLQTIDPATAKSSSARILQKYWQLSGIPVLCNTSANLSGHGFFPDVRTATEWGRTPYVWSDGQLYTNPRR